MTLVHMRVKPFPLKPLPAPILFLAEPPQNITSGVDMGLTSLLTLDYIRNRAFLATFAFLNLHWDSSFLLWT